MKQTVCALLLILGSVGYEPPPIVSLILTSGESMRGVALLELRGDSIRVAGQRWVSLEDVEVFTNHSIVEQWNVKRTDGSELRLDALEVWSDGFLRGRGIRVDSSKAPFVGVLDRNDIYEIKNIREFSLWPYVPLGCAAGWTIGCMVFSGDERINSGTGGGGYPSFGCSRRQSKEFWTTSVGGAVIGSVAGGAIELMARDGTLGRSHFSGLPMKERKKLVRAALYGK